MILWIAINHLIRAKRCKKCGRKISLYAEYCPYCEEKIEDSKHAVRVYLEQLENKPRRQERKRALRARYMRCIMALLLIFFIFGLWFHETYHYRWEVGDETLLYLKDNSLIAKNMKNQEQKTVADDIFFDKEEQKNANIEDDLVYSYPKGHRLYFAKNIKNDKIPCYDLYEQNTNNWTKLPKLIAKDVRMSTHDEDGNLYYVIDNDTALHRYNGRNTRLIELPGVYEFHYMSEYKKLLVLCKKEDDQVSLYHVDTKTFSEQCIVEDLGQQYEMTSDYKKLYYLQKNILFQSNIENEKTEVYKTNVYEFSMATIGSIDQLYYIEYEIEDRSYYSFINDTYAEDDKKPQKDKAVRNQLRGKLKEKMIHIMKGRLHCFDGTADKVFEGNANGLIAASKLSSPYVYKEVTPVLNINMPRYGKDSVIYQLENYLENEDCQETDYKIKCIDLYDYKNTTNALPDPIRAVRYAEYELYAPKDNTLVDEKVTEEETDAYMSMFDETTEKEENLQDSIQTVGERTYKVEFNGKYNLIVEENGGRKILLQNVISYKILPDGRIAAVRKNEVENTTELYFVNIDGSTAVEDSNVSKLFGEDVWTLLDTVD